VDTVAVLLTRMVGSRSLFVVGAKARILPTTLHHYLTGRTLPPDSATLEAIGNACGANEWQLDALVEAWALQKNPPAELRYGGFLYRSDHRSATGTRPGDAYNAALHEVWLRTGVLKPVPGQDMFAAGKALRSWQLTRLQTDGRLRERIRRDLAPQDVPDDPDMLERRVAASFAVGRESEPTREALHLIGIGLLDPDERMRRRALRLLSAPPPPEAAPDAQRAVLATVPDGPGPDWATATAPADRDVVENGIRECYHLCGLHPPASIVWADSPYTGVLLRRLAAPFFTFPLWNRTDAFRDFGVVEFRYPDDLRTRMERDLKRLLGHQGVPQYGGGDDLRLTGGPTLVATDPARARQALEQAAARLPEPRPVLGPGDPAPADGNDRYFHLDGQSLAPWIGRVARRIEALTAAGVAVGDLGDRLAAYRDANTAGPWWPSRQLVIVCERPTTIEPGPILRWSDGTTTAPVSGPSR
jgi:hypothetical protein